MLLWLGISQTTINSEYVFKKPKKEGIVGIWTLMFAPCHEHLKFTSQSVKHGYREFENIVKIAF